jgi:hypothetical protein
MIYNFKWKGGNKKYPQESVSWSALPKIDSGFIYTFENDQTT